jgi:hypothetical protein
MDTSNVVEAHIELKLTAVIMKYPMFFGIVSKTEIPIKNAASEHMIKNVLS